MHILHVQSMKVYASVSFEAVSPWWPPFHSWDSACVPCAHDVVTELAVALHATGVKCDVHHVAEKDAQQFVQVGPSVRTDRGSQASFSRHNQQQRCWPQLDQCRI